MISIKILPVYMIAALFLISCQSAKEKPTYGELMLHDHALSEKIWDVENKTFVEKQWLLNKVSDYNYILLGETHDNSLHHKYQGLIIGQLGDKGQRLSVAFEMINDDKQELLNKGNVKSSDELFDLLQWEKTGWPDRALYKPVFDATLNAKYNIYAANLNRKKLSSIIMGGEEALPENVKQQLNENPLSEEAEAKLRTEIVESHCNLLPEHMVPQMMMGQRVKDATMAKSLVSNKNTDGIVLIAGSGHVQKYGVPIYLKSEDADAKAISIAWIEVDSRLEQPEEYANFYGDEDLPFDFVWFTPRIDRPDPCEELKNHHKFKKK